MNNDLISRKALAEELSSLTMTIVGLRAGKGVLNEYMTEYRKSVLRIVDEAPAVDAEPVRRGEWLPQYFDSICSACGYVNKAELGTRMRSDPKFCPKCGAKMDKEER